MDDSIKQGFDPNSEQGYIYTKLDSVINWVRANSIWPQPMGLACCAIELMGVGGSRSRSMLSKTCSLISRAVKPPQVWIRRSASVLLPWSMCAIMEKLRILSIAERVGTTPSKKIRPKSRAKILSKSGQHFSHQASATENNLF